MERYPDLNNKLDQLVVPIDEGDIPGKRRSVEGWKKVEIKESEEELVDLARDERLQSLIILSPQYYQQEVEGSIERMWVRKGVADALYRAALLLPKECKFKIWDVWRPLAVQQALFNKYLESLREKRPELPEEELKKEAAKYVSLPSKDPKAPSPHNTGGAVDLTIVGPDGKELDMGTKFDHFGPEAKTIFYEEKLRGDVALSERERLVLRNRRLLYSIMITAGFTNYEEEWWHFDFGNQFWGRIKGKVAIYGQTSPVKLINSDEPCRFKTPPTWKNILTNRSQS